MTGLSRRALLAGALDSMPSLLLCETNQSLTENLSFRVKERFALPRLDLA
ncbi:MAG TPA: hypothetical protein VIS76_06035 [Pseudomonadales bacterium]